MLSIPHLVIIFLVALVVLGPDKLPEVARTLGKAMAELRRVTGDFRYQIEGEMRDLERQHTIERRTAETYEYQPTPPPVVGSPQQQSEDGTPRLPQPPAPPPPAEFTGEPLAEPAPAQPAAVAPSEPEASAQQAASAELAASTEPAAPEKPGDTHPA
jgi:Tat protein translocase TatB subunit